MLLASVSSPNEAQLGESHGPGTIPKRARDKTAPFCEKRACSMCAVLHGFSTCFLAVLHASADAAACF